MAAVGEVLIGFSGVSASLGGRRILRRLDWQLRPGEHWVVLGPNGCGKTTFLKLLRGDVAPDPDQGERSYHWNGKKSASPVFAKEDIAFVSPEMQERYLQLEWRHTAWDVVLTGFHGTDYLYRELTRAQKAAAKKLFERLEITWLMKRDVQTLSQGELRKVLVARALVGRPKILLLDEVCDGLDMRTRRRLLEWVEQIARQETQIVMATHRREEFIPSLTHVLELEGGRIRKQGPITGRNAKRPRREVRREDPMEAFRQRIGQHKSRRNGGQFLFQVRDAGVFQGRKWTLENIDWEMKIGENWAVLGHNGAGKSTFLRLLQGEVHPALGGEVRRFNEARRHTLWEIRQRIGFVSMGFQMRFKEELNGADAIATGYFGGHVLYDRLTRKQRGRVDELVELFELQEFAGRSVKSISYGELRRILIARALVHEPAVLILDEPFDGLEQRIRDALDRQLERIGGLGTNLVMVTHHPEDLPACMTHGLLIERGRIVEAGPLQQRPGKVKKKGRR